MTLYAPYLALALGLLCSAIGGERFVRGTVGIAQAARISPAVVSATVAAFATSSPELTVAVSSALAGEPEISLGDALGSNVVNIALILGSALMLGPLAVNRAQIYRDLATAIVAPVLIGLVLADGSISRTEAVILLAVFTIWLGATLRDALRQRASAPLNEAPSGMLRVAMETVFGFALLIAAGKLIVYGCEMIARRFGLSDFVIGATVVSIGTSIPELATAIISRIRQHDEVGVGALLGSNIFNGLFIIGVAGAIQPMRVTEFEAAPALVLGVVALLAIYPPADGVYPRWRGGALLAIYFVYLATLILNA